MALGEGAEGLSGADLEEEPVGVVEEEGEAGVEADGLAHVSCPVGGVGGLFWGEPRAGEVGEEGNGGWVEGDVVADPSGEVVGEWEERARVEGVGCGDGAACDVSGGELLLEVGDGVGGSGDDGEGGAVDGGEVEFVGEPVGEVVWREWDGEHGARGE